MPIDDPISAFEQQYMKADPSLPNKLAKFAADHGLGLALPDGGLALEILLKVIDNLFNKESGQERLRAMFELFRREFQHVERTKASHEDVQKACQLAVWYDYHERDDAKRARYVKLIGSALTSEERIEDVASFIKTIEQLNERDLTVLRVINKVMNHDGDWKQQSGPPGRSTRKVHPSTFIQRAQEMSMEVALALDQSGANDVVNREEGYGICNRLQGFGLAHEIDVQPRELPLTNYAFRLSTYGIRLLKLIGEDVPNYEFYVQKYTSGK
jgi:hypothetical protein